MKKVAFIAQPEYFRFMYDNALNGDFVVREFPFTFHMDSREFLDLLQFDADYNVFFRGEFFPNDVLKKLRGVKIALSSEPFPRYIEDQWEYTRDSVGRYETFRVIKTKLFDYVFHYDEASLPLFKKDELGVSGIFVFPVSLEVYKPQSTLKKWDAFFIGRSTEHREALFADVKHKNNFLHIAHGVHGSELVRYCHKSTICINAHAENEISWEPRMQMLLATGAFVLSEKITPNKYVQPGRDFIEFSDGNDLYQKVNYFIKNKEERLKIIANAQKTIHKHFNAKKSFTNLFNGIDQGQFKKFSPVVIEKTTMELLEVPLVKNSCPSKRQVQEYDICYIVPGVSISGGVAVVLQHANRLKARGYSVALIHLDIEAEENITWFACDVPVYRWDWMHEEFPLPHADIVVATHFSTAKVVQDHAPAACRKIYFVQSDERRFGLDAPLFVEAHASYQMEMEFMTEALWIQRWLKEEFGKDAYYVPNGLDEKIFFPTTPLVPKAKKPRVLLEGPIDVPFKGMEDAYNAVKGLDCELWIISSAGNQRRTGAMIVFLKKCQWRRCLQFILHVIFL